MGRPTGWTRGSRDGNTTPKAASQGASQYDEDEADSGTGAGWSPASCGWVVAEAAKVKDALFLGNIMAVQDANFVMMNKIGHIFKCQQGFPIPQNLRRFGVNYHVMNLMGAFTDASLPVDKKDELLETFYNKMEQAAEEGMGVLLCSFQDLTWACFNVVAFWMRKYLWTVDHAVSVMKSRRATLVLEQNCMTELHLLAERISKRFPKRDETDEENVVTHTFSNSRKENMTIAEGDDASHSPNSRARPITAHAGRIKWNGNVEETCEDHMLNFDAPIVPPRRAPTPILRASRGGRKPGDGYTDERFISPLERALNKHSAPVHGKWSATASLPRAPAPEGLPPPPPPQTAQHVMGLMGGPRDSLRNVMAAAETIEHQPLAATAAAAAPPKGFKSFQRPPPAAAPVAVATPYEEDVSDSVSRAKAAELFSSDNALSSASRLPPRAPSPSMAAEDDLAASAKRPPRHPYHAADPEGPQQEGEEFDNKESVRAPRDVNVRPSGGFLPRDRSPSPVGEPEGGEGEGKWGARRREQTRRVPLHHPKSRPVSAVEELGEVRERELRQWPLNSFTASASQGPAAAYPNERPSLASSLPRRVFGKTLPPSGRAGPRQNGFFEDKAGGVKRGGVDVVLETDSATFHSFVGRPPSAPTNHTGVDAARRSLEGGSGGRSLASAGAGSIRSSQRLPLTSNYQQLQDARARLSGSLRRGNDSGHRPSSALHAERNGSNSGGMGNSFSSATGKGAGALGAGLSFRPSSAGGPTRNISLSASYSSGAGGGGWGAGGGRASPSGLR